jgi:hypothetical protein
MTKATLAQRLEGLRRWHAAVAHHKLRDTVELDWSFIDYILHLLDEKPGPYHPETTPIQRADLLSATDNNLLVGAVLRDLDAAEAVIRGET